MADAFPLRSEGAYLGIDAALDDLLKRRSGPGDRRPGLVLIDAKATPRVGTLVEYRGSNRNAETGGARASFSPIRQVRVGELARRGTWIEAEVAPLTRPRGKPTAAEVATLKKEFAAFARGDEAYRKAIKNPDYRSEELLAVESAGALSNLLLHLVPLSVGRRQELAVMSDSALVRAIRADLKAGASKP